MSRSEVSCNLVGGGHSELLLNTLKSRYPCFHEPLTLASSSFSSVNNADTAPDNDDVDKQYLPSLWVFGNRQVDGPESPLPHSFSNLMVDQNITDPHMIKEKIVSMLKVLSFREQRVLVQFWSPVAVRKRWLLTTWDQPFGLGVADEGLYQYRLNSELRAVVVDEEQREELGPVGRVYSKKMPEWSLDVQGGDTSYNIHGYIDLPVFESRSGCCVGVLEIITSSSYVDYAFEVQEVSRAMKKQNLKSSSMFEDPSFCVSCFQVADERRQHELDEIFKALKMVCDVQNLPLAQTWALAGSSSSVASSGILKRSCSSFNRSCIGKVCMLTAGLPFYVRDLSMWGFRDSCKEKHLEISKGVVGRSLASHGTWFCWNVTELNEDEYPLAPFARMSGLTSCLAIYLKSLEPDVEYVIEFFLPPCETNKKELQRLMKTLKRQIKNISWKQSDIMPTPPIIEVPLYLESQPSPITSLTEKGEIPQPELENLQPFVENEQNDDVMFSKKHNEVVHVEPDNMVNEPFNSNVGGTSRSVVPYLEKEVEDDPGRTKRKYSDIYNGTRKKRKRSESSVGMEEIKKYFGKTMDEAAALLNVSRSTLKRICRNLGIPRWPSKNGPADKSDSLLKLDQRDIIVHGEEGALSPIIGSSNEPLHIANITHDLVTQTKDGKHGSMLVHQQENTNQSDSCLEPNTTIRGKFIDSVSLNAVKFSTIKAIYRENTVKFSFNLSDGLVKLEELVAARFQLGLGSFFLKYVDKDGNKISIRCDNDLTVMSTAFRHLDEAVIRLLVQLVTDQNSDA